MRGPMTTINGSQFEPVRIGAFVQAHDSPDHRWFESVSPHNFEGRSTVGAGSRDNRYGLGAQNANARTTKPCSSPSLITSVSQAGFVSW